MLGTSGTVTTIAGVYLELKRYDRNRIDAKGMPWSSHYVSIEGQCLMKEEGGYRTFPYAVSRYDVAPREVYADAAAKALLP